MISKLWVGIIMTVWACPCLMVYCMVLLSIILFVLFLCLANLPLMMLKIIYPHLCVLLNQFLNLVSIDDRGCLLEAECVHGKAGKAFVR